MDLIEAEILGKLQTAMGAAITTYYQGEVKVPPQSYLPALMVFGTDTLIEARDTLKDVQTRKITVRIVMNVMAFVDQAGTGTVIKAAKQLRVLMEGRNATTGLYLPATVAGVMRNKAQLHGQYYYYDGDLRVRYHTIVAGEFFYAAADCTFDTFTDLIARPGY